MNERNRGGRPRIHANDIERRRAWREKNPEKNRASVQKYRIKVRAQRAADRAAARQYDKILADEAAKKKAKRAQQSKDRRLREAREAMENAKAEATAKADRDGGEPE